MDSFPEEDVAAGRADRTLQQEHSPDELGPEMRAEFEQVRLRRIEEGFSEGILWIYFRSPEETWQALYGREGWLLYDPATGTQLDFRLTVMN
ncbi:MAG: hypothetical protein JJE10_00175 [Thermoleophilia bacterium]|nr:hypothetical protein [Thermoleophilia bacterium]